MKATIFFSASSLLECREDFFREEHFNICVPICPAWRLNNKATTIAVDVVIGISYTSGFIAGIVIVVISVLRKKTMYVSLVDLYRFWL